jgi:hypothetical protein
MAFITELFHAAHGRGIGSPVGAATPGRPSSASTI